MSSVASYLQRRSIGVRGCPPLCVGVFTQLDTQPADSDFGLCLASGWLRAALKGKKARICSIAG